MSDLISREAAIIALMDAEADQIQTKNGTEVIDVIQSVSAVPAISVPEGATNGDMIKALFPVTEIFKVDEIISVTLEKNEIKYYQKLHFWEDWWNAPYKGVHGMNDALKFLTEPMREATKEERESVNNYIKSISERMIPMSVIEEIKAEIAYDACFCESCTRALSIIDKHIKEQES